MKTNILFCLLMLIGTALAAQEFQCGDPVIYEGQTYHTVQIGTQCWFKENLNVGDMMPGTEAPENDPVIEKYCYGNDEENCGLHGALYDWNEAVGYGSGNDICPEGWHIPTNAEVATLFGFLGGQPIAGAKLKESGTTHWEGSLSAYKSNPNATNASGFTAIPSGTRWSTGVFKYIKSSAVWWTSTSVPAYGSAYYFGVMWAVAGATNGQFYHSQSAAVRCLKN